MKYYHISSTNKLDFFLQNVLCEGVGRRVPQAGRYVDPVLDRNPPERRAAMAGWGPHADGLAHQPNHIGLIGQIDVGIKG